MTFTAGECTDTQAQTKPCTKELRPVCGFDSVEYDNACLAQNAGVAYNDGLGHVLGRGLHPDGHRRGRFDQLRRRRLRAGGVFAYL